MPTILKIGLDAEEYQKTLDQVVAETKAFYEKLDKEKRVSVKVDQSDKSDLSDVSDKEEEV